MTRLIAYGTPSELIDYSEVFARLQKQFYHQFMRVSSTREIEPGESMLDNFSTSVNLLFYEQAPRGFGSRQWQGPHG